MNYTYLLRCADSSLYCGWTNRLAERIKAHNAGKGAKYTKSRRPVELVYYEMFGTKAEAMRREAAIKRMSKREKEALVESGTAEKFSVVLKEDTEAGRNGKKGVKGKERGNRLRIIISPAKKMKVRNDEFPWREKPVYIERARELMTLLKACTEPQLKELFGANDTITHENFMRYRNMDPERNLTPAVLAYVGIQYQYMSPQIFSNAEWEYVCRHLRILSGFYGILRADDGIVPYRLEMQAKLPTERGKDLYAYWGDALYRELAGEEGSASILNLASKEYSKAVEPWLQKEDEYVTCIFGTLTEGKVKVKATEAKMARGEMVRFLAGRQAESFEIVKEFHGLGFSFDPGRSDSSQFVFVK